MILATGYLFQGYTAPPPELERTSPGPVQHANTITLNQSTTGYYAVVQPDALEGRGTLRSLSTLNEAVDVSDAKGAILCGRLR